MAGWSCQNLDGILMDGVYASVLRRFLVFSDHSLYLMLELLVALFVYQSLVFAIVF